MLAYTEIDPENRVTAVANICDLGAVNKDDVVKLQKGVACFAQNDPGPEPVPVM